MKPAAETPIDERLVQALLAEQHPDLSTRPVTPRGEGWDNALFQIGDDLCARLPRRAIVASQLEHEHRWLPQLADRLPLPVPSVIRGGQPGCGYPWVWSITRWIPGASALSSPPTDPVATAEALGGFLASLHRPAPAAAPRNPWRGVPLAARDRLMREQVAQLGAHVSAPAVLAAWDEALAAPGWQGPPVWIHGDLHPGNLLVERGALSGVIDFVDLCAGDPATDMAVMWMLLPTPVHPVFLEAARRGSDVRDDYLLHRARGWALTLSVAYMASGDPEMTALGQRTLDAALMG